MELVLVGTGAILSDRLSACAVVDGRILVDTPNGSMKALHRLSLQPSDLDVCLITHFHADHFFDIVFLFLEQGLRRERSEDLIIAGPTGLEERVNALFELSYPESWERVRRNARPRFVEIGDSGGGLANGTYTIEAIPVSHTVPLALGYLIRDACGSTLGFTGDTIYCEGVERLASASNALVIDAAFASSRSGHMGQDDVIGLASRWPNVEFISTHLGDEFVDPGLPNLVVPHDGQSFSI